MRRLSSRLGRFAFKCLVFTVLLSAVYIPLAATSGRFEVNARFWWYAAGGAVGTYLILFLSGSIAYMLRQREIDTMARREAELEEEESSKPWTPQPVHIFNLQQARDIKGTLKERGVLECTEEQEAGFEAVLSQLIDYCSEQTGWPARPSE